MSTPSNKELNPVIEAFYVQDSVIRKLNKTIQRVHELHRAVNGPYDDLACEHCTRIMRYYRLDAPEDVYIGYPCPTIKALDGETDEHSK